MTYLIHYSMIYSIYILVEHHNEFLNEFNYPTFTEKKLIDPSSMLFVPLPN